MGQFRRQLDLHDVQREMALVVRQPFRDLCCVVVTVIREQEDLVRFARQRGPREVDLLGERSERGLDGVRFISGRDDDGDS